MASMTWSDLVGERDAAAKALRGAEAEYGDLDEDTEASAAPAHAHGWERMGDYLGDLVTQAERRLEAADAALEAYEGPRPWILRDGESGTEERIDACDLDEARERAEEWARGGDYDVEGTIWVDVAILDPASRERIDSVTVQIDQPEPECARGNEHDWQSPHEIVGGLRENPGVIGHGGGVIITEVCMHCGCARITDTWAQRPDTGEQGLRSVSYERDRAVEQRRGAS